MIQPHYANNLEETHEENDLNSNNIERYNNIQKGGWIAPANTYINNNSNSNINRVDNINNNNNNNINRVNTNINNTNTVSTEPISEIEVSDNTSNTNTNLISNIVEMTHD